MCDLEVLEDFSIPNVLRVQHEVTHRQGHVLIRHNRTEMSVEQLQNSRLSQALRLDDVLKRVQPQSHDPAVCVYLCSTNVSYVLRNEGYIKILLLEHHVLDDDEGQSGSRPPSI